MTKPKTKEPLESFGPELRELLLRAAKGEHIVLTFPTEKMAHTFRRRIYTLRRRLADANPDEYAVACRAEVGPPTPVDKNNQGPLRPCTLTFRLKDSEFKDVIASAKTEQGPIKGLELASDPLSDLEPEQEMKP
jgi:hypothetical protein